MIVIFDIEGVLVDGEFLPEVAKRAGREKEVHEITLKGISGEIDWEQGLKRRIQLIKGLEYKHCVSVAQNLPLMKGANEVTRELRARGAILVGVSGGFSLLANRVKRELGLDHVFSNELVFHSGRLIGYGLLVNANKTQILDTAFADLFGKERTAAVVDGANDLDLFNIVDLKVAFNAQQVVRKRADIVIEQKDLTQLLEILSDRNHFHFHQSKSGTVKEA